MQGPIAAGAAPGPVYKLVQQPDDSDYKSDYNSDGEDPDEIFNMIAKYWTFIISSEDPDEILNMIVKYWKFIISSEDPDEIYH